MASYIPGICTSSCSARRKLSHLSLHEFQVGHPFRVVLPGKSLSFLVGLSPGVQNRGKQKSTPSAPLESVQSAIKEVRKFQKQVELSCSPDLRSFWCRGAEVSHGCQERFCNLSWSGVAMNLIRRKHRQDVSFCYLPVRPSAELYFWSSSGERCSASSGRSSMFLRERDLTASLSSAP